MKSYAILLIVGLLSARASAASGTVSGYLLFFQNQGNFCPSHKSCTGAKYVESQYQTNMAVQDAKVYIRRASDHVVIGQGISSSTGNFMVNWYDPATSGNVQAVVTWSPEHKDGRFRVTTPSGVPWVFWGFTVTLTNGSSNHVGTMVWGNGAAPNQIANAYDGARRMWANSLSQSNRMLSYFSNATIKTFDDTCPTSCADGPANEIILDTASAFSPQARVMHEMGHLASFKANRDQTRSQTGQLTCFPSTAWSSSSAPCGWSLSDDEWAVISFEEAVATFFADVALYQSNAASPMTCLSSSYCGSSFNLETSGVSCSLPHRKPIDVDRYFWDVYDMNSDFAGETMTRGVWEILDTINAFDNGLNNRQKDEVYAVFGWVDAIDGRSAIDFRENWKTWGTDSTSILAGNCGSAGD